MDKDHAKRVLDHLTKYNGPRLVSRRADVVMAAQRTLNKQRSDVMDLIASGPHPGRGKVFHTKAHDRKKGEKYYTPAWVVRCLLRRVVFEKGIDEPAAGNGQIVRALAAAGYTDVTAEDLTPDVDWIAQADFLATRTSRRHNVLTNPPFGVGGKLAFQFAWHALRLTQQHGGKVAMLMRDDFDSAGGRTKLFQHPAFDMKIVITDRIRWTNLDQDAKKGPSGSHAWFIWDWARAVKTAGLVYEGADEDPMAAALGERNDK